MNQVSKILNKIINAFHQIRLFVLFEILGKHNMYD